jgi:hypothetical protein
MSTSFAGTTTAKGNCVGAKDYIAGLQQSVQTQHSTEGHRGSVDSSLAVSVWRWLLARGAQ